MPSFAIPPVTAKLITTTSPRPRKQPQQQACLCASSIESSVASPPEAMPDTALSLPDPGVRYRIDHRPLLEGDRAARPISAAGLNRRTLTATSRGGRRGVASYRDRPAPLARARGRIRLQAGVSHAESGFAETSAALVKAEV